MQDIADWLTKSFRLSPSWVVCTVKPVQTATSIKQPSSKTDNAGSTQANYHTIVIVQDNHGSNGTSEHFFFVSQMKKKTCRKQPLENFTQRRNGKQRRQ